MLALLLILVVVLGLAWFLTIPIRFAFRLVFGVIFGLLRVVLRLLFSPILLLVVGFFVVAAFVLGVVSHLFPLVVLALVGWGVYRLVAGRSVSTI